MLAKGYKVSLLTGAAAAPALEHNRTNPTASRRALRGWIHPVGPNKYGRMGRLTAEEVLRVNFATIRESFNHRSWPREVLEKIMAADVVTPSVED